MDEGNGLLTFAIAAPADHTARGVLADWCDENGYADLARLLRHDLEGRTLLGNVWSWANTLKRRPCLRLTWAVAFVLDGIGDHERERREESAEDESVFDLARRMGLQ